MEQSTTAFSQFKVLDTWSSTRNSRALDENVCSYNCKVGRLSFSKVFIEKLRKKGIVKVVVVKNNLTGDTLLLFNKNDESGGHVFPEKGAKARINSTTLVRTIKEELRLKEDTGYLRLGENITNNTEAYLCTITPID